MDGIMGELVDAGMDELVDGWMDGRKGCAIKLLQHLEEKEGTCVEGLMKGWVDEEDCIRRWMAEIINEWIIDEW